MKFCGVSADALQLHIVNINASVEVMISVSVEVMISVSVEVMINASVEVMISVSTFNAAEMTFIFVPLVSLRRLVRYVCAFFVSSIHLNKFCEHRRYSP